MAERIAPAEVERLKKLVGHVREDMRDYYGQFYDVWREQIVDFAAYEVGWEVRSNKATFGVEFDLPARSQLRSAVLSTPLIVEGINKGELLRNGGISAERFSELNLNRNFEPRTLEEMRKLEPLAFDKIKASGVGFGSNDYGAAIDTVSHVKKIDVAEVSKLLDLRGKEVRDAILGVYEKNKKYRN